MQNRIKIIILFIIPFLIFSCKSTDKISHGKVAKESSGRDNDKATFYDATKAYITGNFDEAERLYRKCLAESPGDAAAMFELAKISLLKNQRHDAFIYAQQAVKLEPDNKFYLLLYGSLLQSLEQYDKAVKVYEKVLELNPNNPDYYNRLAIAYLYAGKSQKAIEVYNKLEEKIGITEEVSMRKQALYLEMGKPEKAVEEIEKLIKQYPSNTKLYGTLAEICLANGMEDKALEAYRKIEEIDPNDPYINISLADYYKKKGEEEKAFEELKKGFSNENLDIDTKVQILLSYYNANEYYNKYKEQAFELANILIKVHPGEAKAWSVYGDLLYQDDKLDEARKAFRKVISIDSSKYIVWEQLLFIESQLEDNDALLNESLRAIELFPEMPLPYLFSGMVYYIKKEWEKCIKVLSVGVNYVVNNDKLLEQFFIYLGDAYNQIGDHKKSDSSYEEVLKINPNNDFVLNNYAYYLSLRNENLDKAAQMAKKSVELKPGSPANLDTYGWVLYKMGDYVNAEIWIKKALDNGGDTDADVLEHYGDVLWKLGRQNEAVTYWEKAKETGGGGSEFLNKKIETKKLIEE